MAKPGDFPETTAFLSEMIQLPDPCNKNSSIYCSRKQRVWSTGQLGSSLKAHQTDTPREAACLSKSASSLETGTPAGVSTSGLFPD